MGTHRDARARINGLVSIITGGTLNSSWPDPFLGSPPAQSSNSVEVFILKVLLFVATAVHLSTFNSAHAQVPVGPSDDIKQADHGFAVDGKYIYLVCIYGSQDSGEVQSKCKDIKDRLRAQYHPKKRIVQINNPSEERLKRYNENKDGNIAFVIVVTHSTPELDGDGWDVWDTDMDPSDIAECFDDEWVIWNGCYSKAVCEDADNLLPVQCEDKTLSVDDDTWWSVVECLFGSDGPITKDDVCDEVFGDSWRSDLTDDRDE